MTERTVLIRGPLTDEELGRIVAVMQDIEGARPEETFYLDIDAPDATVELAQRINPPRPGYSRITITREDDPA